MDSNNPASIRAASVQESLRSGRLRPAEFMRGRRPELFSDSTYANQPMLTREMFGYHLETLTSRKQETAFEHFCRRLAEKEICPNLLPQTGPTGGGDSKADAETYPVADEIASRWYDGLPGAASQRWAFAFSAKREWRTKVRSDVQKIVDTARPYDLIYFMTNQYVKDKKRAEVEEELTSKHGRPVRILDRTWIIGVVFDHDRLGIAVETLGLDTLQVRPNKTVGPRDFKRKQQLEQLDREIEDTERYTGVGYQLVEDALSAALLARGLELPRVEIDGRFSRAERLSQSTGTIQQQLRVLYNRAWTAYWWYEDYEEFRRLYDRVEEMATKSDQACDLELLTNLWNLLQTISGGAAADGALGEHRARLFSSLEALASDKTRPNNALWARTNLILGQLPAAKGVTDELNNLFRQLGSILEEVDLKIDYPFEPLERLITEFGEWVTDNDDYDALLEAVIKIAKKRLSNREAGRLLLARAFQKLRARKIYDAIRFFGRAQERLVMREAREELVEALFGCGLAYEAAGLFWAARGSVLSAMNQAAADFREHGHLSIRMLMCVRKMVWLELQLGRVPFVLEWINVAAAVASALGFSAEGRENFDRERESQDAVLSLLMLKANQPELNRLRYLPDVLDCLRLPIARMALLYALGYEDELRAEGSIPSEESAEVVCELFERWIENLAFGDVPEGPTALAPGSRVRSHVLGCDVFLETDDDNESMFLGERILSAIEALLATSVGIDLLPHVEELSLRVERNVRVRGAPESRFDDAEHTVVVAHNIPGSDASASSSVGDWLPELVINIACRLALIRHPQSYAKRVFGEEAGLFRAINFSDASIPVRNILGSSPKFRLSDWNNAGSPRGYPLRRESPWSPNVVQAQDEESFDDEYKRGTGDPPKEVLDWSSRKHTERKVFSLINMALWERAQWRGTLYVTTKDDVEPPFLALLFGERNSGIAIFRGWRAKLGAVDSKERLRVSVITGIDKANPYAYRVVVGSNIRLGKDRPRIKEIVSLCRIHRMDPIDPENLQRFQRSFEQTGKYTLLPASYAGPGSPLKLHFEYAIQKTTLRVVPAWQISEHDLDSVAITPEDAPIIPAEIQNPAVAAVIARRRKHSPGW